MNEAAPKPSDRERGYAEHRAWEKTRGDENECDAERRIRECGPARATPWWHGWLQRSDEWRDEIGHDTDLAPLPAAPECAKSPDDMHSETWQDGNECSYCGAAAMPDSERASQGMEPRNVAAPAQPVATLTVRMDRHDMGQSLAPNPPYKAAYAYAKKEAESLPLGEYLLYLVAPPLVARPAISDERIESVLRLPVADGEDVAFYLLHGCEGVSPEVEAIMVREVARTILAAQAEQQGSDHVDSSSPVPSEAVRAAADGIAQLRGECNTLVGILRDAQSVIETIVPENDDEAEKLLDLRVAMAHAVDPYKREGTLL